MRKSHAEQFTDCLDAVELLAEKMAVADRGSSEKVTAVISLLRLTVELGRTCAGLVKKSSDLWQGERKKCEDLALDNTRLARQLADTQKRLDFALDQMQAKIDALTKPDPLRPH